MDVHGRDAVDLAAERRAAKGKGKGRAALPYDEFDELPSRASPMRTTRPTSIDSTRHAATITTTTTALDSKIAPSAESSGATQPGKDVDRDFYVTHPFEAGLVDVLEATEKKVAQWWSWISQDKPAGVQE